MNRYIIQNASGVKERRKQRVAFRVALRRIRKFSFVVNLSRVRRKTRAKWISQSSEDTLQCDEACPVLSQLAMSNDQLIRHFGQSLICFPDLRQHLDCPWWCIDTNESFLQSLGCIFSLGLLRFHKFVHHS